jgi:hypothetical protein
MLLQNFAAIENRFMLGHAGHDMIALVPVRLGHAFDREVVGLGRSAGKHNFPPGGSADQPGKLLSSAVHRRLRFPAKRMTLACRIAKAAGEVGQHGIQHPRIDLGSRVIIEINRCFDRHFSCPAPYQINSVWFKINRYALLSQPQNKTTKLPK